MSSRGTSGTASGWRLSSRPVFRTGREDDEPTFESVQQGVIRDNLSVVVSDVNAQFVYVFAPDGELLHQLGGRGQGPGEFEGLLTAVAGNGDSIFVQDRTGLALFVDGESVEEQRVEWRWRTGQVTLATRARDAAGSLFLTPYSWSPVQRNGGWSRAPVVRLSSDLADVDTLVVVDHHLLRLEEDWNPIMNHGFTAIGGQRIVYGRNDRAEVSWYDIEGKLAQVARWEHDFREVTDEDWIAYEAAMRDAPGPELAGARLETVLSGQKEDFRGSLPAYGGMIADALGNVWLSEYTHWGRLPSYFNIISATGEWLGEIDWPAGAWPLAITDTHVLGVERDEWEIQAVVLYEIIKPE